MLQRSPLLTIGLLTQPTFPHLFRIFTLKNLAPSSENRLTLVLYSDKVLIDDVLST